MCIRDRNKAIAAERRNNKQINKDKEWTNWAVGRRERGRLEIRISLILNGINLNSGKYLSGREHTVRGLNVKHFKMENRSVSRMGGLGKRKVAECTPRWHWHSQTALTHLLSPPYLSLCHHASLWTIVDFVLLLSNCLFLRHAFQCLSLIHI